MLSTDENPPVHLPCSSSSSQLIKGCSTSSNICSDEKDSVENDQKLQFKLDLFKSSSALDENKEPVSNFSIRDYVFSTRDKDIKTHWPFSAKNLQLCLKHGVSNVLPPFQTPHSVKNTSTLDSKAQESPSSSKVVRNTRITPVKNCKSAVKLSGNINSEFPKPSKDHSLKTTLVTDHTMASKVCPVCKTFSSSSNTTLNAHIDQCLSEGPPSNFTANSKVIIKHRIKPRKIRLMVDIYATALRCTLEDLDRRNGTKWASSSNPAKELKGTSSVPPTDNEEKNETFKDVEGAVYVDSSGTKLRILSKFSDLPSIPNAVDDSSFKKVVKADKGYKFLSSKKKKYLLQNHKHLKSSSHEKILDHCPKTKDYEPKNISSKESVKKHDQRQPLEMRDRMISDDFGIVKKWVGSTRTLSKKKKNILEHERHRMQKTTMKNLRIRNRLLTPPNDHEIIGKGTSDCSSPPLSEKITSLSAESHKRKENMSFYSHDGHTEHRCLEKRTKQHNHGKKSHLSLSKSKASQKDGTSEHDRGKEILHGSRDRVSSNCAKHIRAHVSPVVKHDDCSRRSRMSQNQAISNGTEDFLPQKNPSLDHKILSNDKNFSSSKRNLPSYIKYASVSESKKNVEIKCVGLKKRKLRYSSESDEEPIVPRPTICRRTDDLVKTLNEDVSHREQLFDKLSNDRFKEFKVQKSCLKNSLGSISHCIGKNTDDSYLGNDVETGTSNTQDAIKEVEGTDFMAFDKYLDSELPSYARSVPLHFVKGADEVSVGEQENGALPMGKCDHMVIPNTSAVIEIDANEDQRNYYANIDPIPIPGPPGSFLPSPGRMGSDELQGSSSLTSCRMIHSSEDDDHELVDMGSSDSPISAISIVSNSIVDGSDSLSIIDPSKHQSGVQVETQFRDTSSYRAAEFSRIVQHNESVANMISSELSPRGLIRSSKPCCCSRKGALRSDFLYYQESPQVLRQQTMNSSRVDGNMMYKLNSFNSRSEVLNMEDQPTSEPDKVIANSSVISHNHYESSSPTTPNPVLRLMGKNLMVVNKEENVAPKIRPTQAVVNEHLGSKSFSDNGRSDMNMQNMQCSYNVISNQGNRQTTNNAVEFIAPNDIRMHSGFRKPELFPQKSFNGICMPSLEYRDYEGGFGPTRDHLTPNISMSRSNVCEDAKFQTHHLEVNLTPLSSIDALKNPFYFYKTHDHHLSNAALMVQNAYTRAPYSMEMLENPKKWNVTAENPRILRTNSFTASSSLPGLPRSSSQYISAMRGFPERR